jgi:hypothetical protein
VGTMKKIKVSLDTSYDEIRTNRMQNNKFELDYQAYEATRWYSTKPFRSLNEKLPI